MKVNINELLVFEEYTIKDALKILDINAKGIVVVVDKNKRLIGTVTDGDIRRALLRGANLSESILNVMHSNPITAPDNISRDQLKDIFIRKAIKQLPIINESGMLIDLISINDILLPQGKENPVIIMAGGLGTRLKDLTKEIPKPMLKVGDHPMLQHIINNFKQYGYNKIFITVNYKAEIIENYFQDGLAYGVKINYIREKERLGTAGGIRLAKEHIQTPFFVINGDIFTNLNVESMMDFHIKSGNCLTVGTRKQYYNIPYGVINIENNKIKSIEEKPEIEYLINAGVYCVNPDLMEFIPKDTYFEITDLINFCIKQGYKVGSFEIIDYWMDIGKIEDYNRVNEDVYDIL